MIVTIQTQIPSYEWIFGGTTATLRVKANGTFNTSDGTQVLVNTYKSVACTISGTVLTIPSFTIDSSTDGVPNNVTFDFIIYDERGAKRWTIGSQWRIPDTLGSSISWQNLKVYNDGTPITFFNETYTKDEIDSLIQNYQPIIDASGANIGKTRLTLDPVVAAVPIAVGDNDDRMNSFAITAIETSASVTPVDFGYQPGDVRRYGAVLDGVTNDITAWVDADAQSQIGGAPIYVPKSANGMAISSGVVASIGTDIHFEEGAFLLYTGSSNEAALTLGSTSTFNNARTFQNLAVRRLALSDWTSEDSIGIRGINLKSCKVDISFIEQFTIGLECASYAEGYAYCSHLIRRITDNKIAINLVSLNSPSIAWVNENIFIGGRISVSSTTHTTSDRFGVRIDSQQAVKYYSNSNLFLKQSFELNASNTSGIARPVLLNYAKENQFLAVRDENNDQPFMQVENDSDFNRADTTIGISEVQNNGVSAYNTVTPQRRFLSKESAWNSNDIPSLCNEYKSSQIYVASCSIRTSSTSTPFKANTNLAVVGDYLEFPSTRAIGVTVDTSTQKRFLLKKDVEASHEGRFLILVFDAAQNQLTTDGGYVLGTSATVPSHITSFGGAYRSGSDSADDLFFSVSSAVKYIWVGVQGGSSVVHLRSFGIVQIDGGSLAPFQGWVDNLSDPFPNNNLAYATAFPATSSLGLTYPNGKRIIHDLVTSGESPGWACVTQGNPGVWESEGVLS